MKKLLIVIGFGLLGPVLFAGHIALDSKNKSEFTAKRLQMMKDHLQTKQGELLMLEGSLKALPQSNTQKTALVGARVGARISQLKNELIELEKRIPVIQNSLQALNTVVK